MSPSDAPPTLKRQRVRPVRRPGLINRMMRRLYVGVGTLVAMLILFYATSIHGISLRTLLLAAVVILFLYWVFQDLFERR